MFVIVRTYTYANKFILGFQTNCVVAISFQRKRRCFYQTCSSNELDKSHHISRGMSSHFNYQDIFDSPCQRSLCKRYNINLILYSLSCANKVRKTKNKKKKDKKRMRGKKNKNKKKKNNSNKKKWAKTRREDEEEKLKKKNKGKKGRKKVKRIDCDLT
eukprot:Pompholyxophrys_sp_v1_NODE_128_length_1707_cov_2.950363.p2 type:complete len:158 gc:universal NODE_128_length_1707_cov_2.950363:588-115(-)